MRRRFAPLLLAIGVGIFAFVWLAHTNPVALPVNEDAIRDQLLARDCTELGLCHLLGAPSSFGGFFHGAVWIDVITAVRLLDGGSADQRTMVLVVLALSVVIVLIVVWHWLRPTMAVPAALYLLAMLGGDMPATLLINPSIAVYPDILTAATLLCFGLSGRLRFLILAAFSLGVAMSMHTASLALLAPALLIAAMVRPQAWRDVLLTLIIAAVVYGWPSSATLRANTIALRQLGLVVPMIFGGAAIVAVARRCGPFFRRQPWDLRAGILGAVLIGPFSLLLLWLLFARHHHFTFVYLHPILAPAAVTLSALTVMPFTLIARWWRTATWIPTVAAVALMAFVFVNLSRGAVPDAPTVSTWSLAEVEAIGDWAARRGWSYDDLVLRVQADGCHEILAGLTQTAARSAPAAIPEAAQLQVQRLVASDAVIAPSNVLRLSSGAVSVREITSWMRPRALRTCRAAVAGGAAMCGRVASSALDAFQPERFLFLRRSFPVVERIDPPARPYVATYELPLVTVKGEGRTMAIAADDVARGWRIVRADGVRIDGSLPATRARLDAAADRGLIVFERRFDPNPQRFDDADTFSPPCVVETLVEDDPSQKGRS